MLTTSRPKSFPLVCRAEFVQCGKGGGCLKMRCRLSEPFWVALYGQCGHGYCGARPQ